MQEHTAWLAATSTVDPSWFGSTTNQQIIVPQTFKSGLGRLNLFLIAQELSELNLLSQALTQQRHFHLQQITGTFHLSVLCVINLHCLPHRHPFYFVSLHLAAQITGLGPGSSVQSSRDPPRELMIACDYSLYPPPPTPSPLGHLARPGGGLRSLRSSH